MSIRTELTVRLPNSPGATAAVCRLLADEHVNILALGLDAMGQLRLVVDNHVHANGVLSQQHYRVTERPVIFINTSNAPGSFASVLRLMADAGVNIDYAYGGAAEGATTAGIVVGLDD